MSKSGVIDKSFDNILDINEAYFQRLNSYFKKSSFREPTEARKLLGKKNSIELDFSTIQKPRKDLRNKKDLEHAKLNLSTNIKNSDSINSVNYYIEILKEYLEEDKHIGPTEARNRLQEETDLSLNISTIRRYLKKLREELGPEYVNLDPCIVKNRILSNRTKLKDSHLALIKKYLIQDNYIGPKEVNRKLQADTSLVIDTSTIQKAMKKLRKEMGLELSTLDQSIVENRQLNDRSKLKDLHLEFLKKYLKKDNYMGPTEARDKLQEDTGLSVHSSTVRNAMIELKKQMDLEYTSLDPSMIKSRKVNDRSKFKFSHLECLKKYLEEDAHIGPTKVKTLLYQETGLVVSTQAISIRLKKLKKEMGLDFTKSNLSININQNPGKQPKLKDSHIEFLKNYLKEDNFIGPKEANNRLQVDTGLEISYSTTQKAIMSLRKEMNLEHFNLDPSTTKDRRSNKRSKLKDLHLEFLKKYLNENRFIIPREIKSKIREDTGLEISETTARNALKALKNIPNLDV